MAIFSCFSVSPFNARCNPIGAGESYDSISNENNNTYARSVLFQAAYLLSLSSIKSICDIVQMNSTNPMGIADGCEIPREDLPVDCRCDPIVALGQCCGSTEEQVQAANSLWCVIVHATFCIMQLFIGLSLIYVCFSIQLADNFEFDPF